MEHGSVLSVEEFLHGKLHRLKMRITNVIADREIRYRMAPGLFGAFRIEPRNGHAQFTAEIAIGWNLPLLGFLLDGVLRLLLSQQLQGLEQHMHEEGENLRKLFEEKLNQ